MARGDEGRLWESLRVGMASRWVAQRIEDRYAIGVPDVYYALRGGGGRGWIELKVFAEPRREMTRIDTRGLTPVQRAWLERFGRHGGTFVLCRVGRETFLVRGADVRGALDQATMVTLRVGAARHWTSRIDYDDLRRALEDDSWVT